MRGRPAYRRATQSAARRRGALSSWTAPRTKETSRPRRPLRPTPRRDRTCGASVWVTRRLGHARWEGGQAGRRQSARRVRAVKDGRDGSGLSALSAERAERARESVDRDELGSFEQRRTRERGEGGDDARGGVGDHDGGDGDDDLDDDVVRQARSLQAQVERAAALPRPADCSGARGRPKALALGAAKRAKRWRRNSISPVVPSFA